VATPKSAASVADDDYSIPGLDGEAAGGGQAQEVVDVPIHETPLDFSFKEVPTEKPAFQQDAEEYFSDASQAPSEAYSDNFEEIPDAETAPKKALALSRDRPVSRSSAQAQERRSSGSAGGDVGGLAGLTEGSSLAAPAAGGSSENNDVESA
jgi:hypothetical protein